MASGFRPVTFTFVITSRVLRSKTVTDESRHEPINIAVDKGLNKILFEDDYRQQCSIQKSNAALDHKIWLGVDKDINGKAVNARMHFTQEQLKDLLPYLQKFVGTGELF